MAKETKNLVCELCEAENDGVKFRAAHKMRLCANCSKEGEAEAAKLNPPKALEPVVNPGVVPRGSKAEIADLIVKEVDLLERRQILSFATLYRLIREHRLAK